MNVESVQRPNQFTGVPKFLTVSILVILFPITSFSVIRVASNGNWTSPGTWLPTGVPSNNDSLIIPAGVSVTLNSNVGSSTLNLKINLSGVLVFDNGKLHITASSVIYLQTTGAISCAGSCGNNDQLRIGGSSNKVWQGDNCGPVNGPGTIDFSFNYTLDPFPLPLPVRFLNPVFHSQEPGKISISWPFVSDSRPASMRLLNSQNGYDFDIVHKKEFLEPDGSIGHFQTDLSFGSYGPYWKVAEVSQTYILSESSIHYHKIKLSEKVAVFPTVVQDHFSINSPNEFCQISLISLSGDELSNKVIKTGEPFFIDPFPNGTYLISVISGTEISVHRIQIQR